MKYRKNEQRKELSAILRTISGILGINVVPRFVDEILFDIPVS